MENILVGKQDYICTVTINSPGKRNSLNSYVLKDIITVFNSINTDADVRVVILRGAGEKAFCAGADIEALMVNGVAGNLIPHAVQSVANCRYPVIAMIYGYAIGAGCDLSSACDFRVIADTAKIGINPVKLGIIYFPEAIQRFIDLVGISYAKELFFTGRFLTAQRAKEIGLVNYVVCAEDLASFTYAFAKEIAENAPLAVTGHKTIMNKLLESRLSEPAKTQLHAIMQECWQTEDLKEGLTAFIEKRKPNFHGK
jgi:enoyl-CoA hydratase